MPRVERGGEALTQRTAPDEAFGAEQGLQPGLLVKLQDDHRANRMICIDFERILIDLE